MDITIFLARVLGLYLIIISLTLFFNVSRMRTLIRDLINQPSLLFVLGFNVLIIGILLVVSHNVWVSSWPVVITIIAWAALIKGIMNVAFPSVAINLAEKFLQVPTWTYVSGAINLILGLFLCYFGFIA